MKHVRKFLALTLVLVLALGIVGCAAPAAPDTSDAQAPAEQTTDESKPIKLTLWSCNDMIRPNELKEGQETWYISLAIERFRELYPNVTIEINAYNDNAQLMNDFKAATRAGYGPDIACFVNGPALISLKDGLLPLNDYLDDDLRTKVVGWETCAEGMNADGGILGIHGDHFVARKQELYKLDRHVGIFAEVGHAKRRADAADSSIRIDE